MKSESYVDKIFRGYGEEFFGKVAMDQITSEQVEEARCFAMTELHHRTATTMEKQPDGMVEELFCNYIFGHFM